MCWLKMIYHEVGSVAEIVAPEDVVPVTVVPVEVVPVEVAGEPAAGVVLEVEDGAEVLAIWMLVTLVSG